MSTEFLLSNFCDWKITYREVCHAASFRRSIGIDLPHPERHVSDLCAVYLDVELGDDGDVLPDGVVVVGDLARTRRHGRRRIRTVAEDSLNYNFTIAASVSELDDSVRELRDAVWFVFHNKLIVMHTPLLLKK